MAVLVTVIAINTPPATPSSLARNRGLCYPTSLPALFGLGELYYLTFQVLCAGRGRGVSSTISPLRPCPHNIILHGCPCDSTGNVFPSSCY